MYSIIVNVIDPPKILRHAWHKEYQPTEMLDIGEVDAVILDFYAKVAC